MGLFMHTILALGVILVSTHVSQSETITPSPSPAPGPGPALAPGPGGYSPSDSGLQTGYYKGKCPNPAVDIEAIVLAKIQKAFKKDPTLLPAMLRLQFHDCFVQGCDASILISGDGTEKTAEPNLSVRGYEVIDAIKDAVEKECPDVVSCADITALATAFLLQLGGGPAYEVETGRRDGLVSNTLDVDLPSPTMSVPDAVAFFGLRNFTAADLVVLLGAHTVGITHCKVIESRLYPSGAFYDPDMDSDLRTQLQALCPEGSMSENILPLNQDPASDNTITNSFYNQLNLHRGVLTLDQALAQHPDTQSIVLRLSLNNALFKIELAKAIRKLQAFQVLTGDEGEIRKVCSKFN